MKFDIGDLVDYRPIDDLPIYTGIVLKKHWEDRSAVWCYKLYFISEDDAAWIEEDKIKHHGGCNGL